LAHEGIEFDRYQADIRKRRVPERDGDDVKENLNSRFIPKNSKMSRFKKKDKKKNDSGPLDVDALKKKMRVDYDGSCGYFLQALCSDANLEKHPYSTIAEFQDAPVIEREGLMALALKDPNDRFTRQSSGVMYSTVFLQARNAIKRNANWNAVFQDNIEEIESAWMDAKTNEANRKALDFAKIVNRIFGKNPGQKALK
jgi:uncharacterized protein RhaS with RHS repeats